MDSEERTLSEREMLREVVLARLNFSVVSNQKIDTEYIASLITDDILSSRVRINRDTVMLERGRDAGFEKGLRDSIAVVGMLERTGPGDEPNLIDYQAAQHAIATLSSHGLVDLFTERGGIVPPYITEKIEGHEHD